MRVRASAGLMRSRSRIHATVDVDPCRRGRSRPWASRASAAIAAVAADTTRYRPTAPCVNCVSDRPYTGRDANPAISAPARVNASSMTPQSHTRTTIPGALKRAEAVVAQTIHDQQRPRIGED